MLTIEDSSSIIQVIYQSNLREIVIPTRSKTYEQHIRSIECGRSLHVPSNTTCVRIISYPDETVLLIEIINSLISDRCSLNQRGNSIIHLLSD
jgi:hypothetical protein